MTHGLTCRLRAPFAPEPYAARLPAAAAGLLLCALLLAFSGGCIRETLPECPPLQITLTVKGRNYFNIDDAVKLGMMERVADDFPFRRYVHSLYYVVYDEAGRIVAEQRNIRIRNDDATQPIVLPASLPYGRYTLTVWGNMDDEGSLGAGSTGSFSVTRDQGFKKEIVLNRQVAGVYVYA